MLVLMVLTALALCGVLASARKGVAAAVTRRTGAALLAVGSIVAAAVLTSTTAGAAIVPTVELGTSSADAVLAGSAVTNTGASVLNGSLGLWPGTSVTGFPPGIVVAPGTTDINNPVAQQAQDDLTAAYIDAEGRPIDATTPADLVNLNLQAGVYAGPNKSPLALSGPLTLDGAGDPTSVFIFQTDSSLITSSSSTVNLINGAQACNVFWQVGSSATLGTNSSFAGNILALTAITVDTNVTVEGRALARNGAVTLDADTFVEPSCNLAPPATTTSTSSTVPGGGTTVPGGGTTVPGGGTTVPGGGGGGGGGGGPTVPGGGGATPPGGNNPPGGGGFSPGPPYGAIPPTFRRTPLPATGAPSQSLFLVAMGAIALGGGLLGLSRVRRAAER